MDEIGGDPGTSLWSGGLFSRLDACDRALHHLTQSKHLLGRTLAGTHISARGLLLALIALLLLLTLPKTVETFLRKRGYLRPNFRNDPIPVCYGLFPLLFAALLFGINVYLTPSTLPTLRLWLVTIIVFGGLGYWDDTRGNRDYRGLKGHVQALLKERKVTTGFLKAAGGLVCAGWLAWQLYPSEAHFLVATLLIALSANAVNLLDVRPGRACGVFLFSGTSLVIFLLLTHGKLPPLLYVLLPTGLVWKRDSRAQVMLGDTGSNLLGASLGLALAGSEFILWFQLVGVLLLVGLHLLTERTSLTRLIEQNRVLNWLDNLTGVR